MTKSHKKSLDTQQELAISFEQTVVRTKQGTPLVTLTMRRIQSELDGYLHFYRTGVFTMDQIRFPWNKVFAAAGVDPSDPNRGKVLDYVEKQLEQWLKHRPTATAGAPTLDPDFKKEAPKVLHALLKSSGNKMKLEGLVTLYCIKTERDLSEENQDFVRTNLRAYIYQDEAFHITRGGMATVYRTTDEKGKETGVEIEEPSMTASSSNKAFQRYSKHVQDTGISKADFDMLKRKHGSVTMSMIKELQGSKVPF